MSDASRAEYMRAWRAKQRKRLPCRGRLLSTRSNTGFRGIHRHERTDEYFGEVWDGAKFRRKKVSIKAHGEGDAFLEVLAWRLEQLHEIHGLCEWDLVVAKARAATWLRRLDSWKTGSSALKRLKRMKAGGSSLTT